MSVEEEVVVGMLESKQGLHHPEWPRNLMGGPYGPYANHLA